MNIKRIITLCLLCFALTIAYNNSFARSEVGGKQETALNKKVDTQNLSGVNLWIAELYNKDRLMYAIVVVLVMAALGSIMAFGTDLVLKHFGMSVSRISHSE